MFRCFAILLLFGAVLDAQAGLKLPLHQGWAIQPSSDVPEKGEAISDPAFVAHGWYEASVPSTVVAALVKDKVYPDPYFGMNLRSIPGATYPIGDNFSNIRMPPGSPFRRSWWYRTRFQIPANFASHEIHLHLNGVNFRANVWLNGHCIADSKEIAGSWRIFDLDVTEWAHPGAANALALEVFPPTPEDLAITFVDWNPAPPDKGMGVWRDVYLTASGPVTIQFPQVITTLDLPSADKAHLTVTAELRNSTSHAVSGVLRGNIENIEFSQQVTLQANATNVVTFSSDRYPQLNVQHPRLWWPAHLGAQNLYRAQFRFETAVNVASDEATIEFGIRQITSSLQHEKQDTPGGETEAHRLFEINGKKILIRGAGYSFDMLLRESADREEQELQYVRDMNLNTVRLEGKLPDENFLRLADHYGILVMTGWCCCDHWEQWDKWDDEDRMIAAQSLRDQIRRIRSHPAVFNWMNGSDNPPPPDIERMYVGILKELNWPNPYESSATARTTPVTGESGVKMTGPYGYVPPSYWLLDKTLGGAHGFNTETSPGAAVPPIESLRQMLPSQDLWPVDSVWNYHAGGGVFKDIHIFSNALEERYGSASGPEDYARKAQALEYEGERAMFEAYGRNKYTATGVIQWMLNNAWPSVIWHLYDYYLRPGGGYFGTKKACEPLHVQYSYDDRSIAVVNSYYKDFHDLTISAKVYNLDLTEKFSREAKVDVSADGVVKPFVIPQIEGLSTTYFVRLTLTDESGKQVSSNFYWLSTKPDKLAWDRSTWYYTPTTSASRFHEPAVFTESGSARREHDSANGTGPRGACYGRESLSQHSVSRSSEGFATFARS